MTTNTITTNTITLHRILRASPARIYAAFVNPAAFAKWLAPHGYSGAVQQMDARVGGTYKMSFTEIGSGQGHSFGGTYRDLVPGERLVYTAVFDDPGMPGEMQTTVELKTVACGTEVHITQEGVPGMIPAEMCYLGWQQSLALLALLVEGP